MDEDTYTHGWRNGEEYIKCLSCGRRSYDKGDIENLYCGHCHAFHEHGATSRDKDRGELKDR